MAIEGIELTFAIALARFRQFVREVIHIAVKLPAPAGGQHSLFLDEIDEHQAVEHKRGIPFAV